MPAWCLERRGERSAALLAGIAGSRPARPGAARLERWPCRRCATPATVDVRAHRGGAAHPTAGHRASPRRARRQGGDRGGRPGLRDGRHRRGAAGHRVHVGHRRAGDLSRAVRDTGHRRATGVADPLHELGAQRRRRLLAHRGALDAPVDQPGRLRRQRCRRRCWRPSRSASPRARRCCWWPATCRTPSRCTRCGPCPMCSRSRCCCCPRRSRRRGGLRLTTDARRCRDTRCRTPALDALRAAIPAARALPLLEAMARGEPGGAWSLDAEHGFALSLALERGA